MLRYYSSDQDDRWNMDRISLNVAIPKSKGSEEEKYYVTGEINELGTICFMKEPGRSEG
jgi:hypothetical protein